MDDRLPSYANRLGEISEGTATEGAALASYTAQFHSIWQSDVTHPLCRDEFWSWSRVTAHSAECKMCDISVKSPSEVQKRENFRKFSSCMPNFLEVSRRTLLVAEVPNRYFGSRVTTCAELNEIAQYTKEPYVTWGIVEVM
jgi:hypothetical protein